MTCTRKEAKTGTEGVAESSELDRIDPIDRVEASGAAAQRLSSRKQECVPGRGVGQSAGQL